MGPDAGASWHFWPRTRMWVIMGLLQNATFARLSCRAILVGRRGSYMLVHDYFVETAWFFATPLEGLDLALTVPGILRGGS